MSKHWKYLKYVARHKLFVFQEGLKLNVPLWQLLIHDLSKFRPDEWRPYAEYFYGLNGGSWYVAPDTLLLDNFDPEQPYKEVPNEQKAGREDAFNLAWLKHLHRNPHHWQHYILRNDSGTTEVLAMPYHYMLEMIADWKGAGRAIHGKNETREWYLANCEKMMLHPVTRKYVEDILQLELLATGAQHAAT
jgi:hypothetical protein